MENMTRTGSTYGTVTINLWEKGNIRRAYINSSMLSKGAGYIDLTTGKVVDTSGNNTIMTRIMADVQMPATEIVAHFAK